MAPTTQSFCSICLDNFARLCKNAIAFVDVSILQLKYVKDSCRADFAGCAGNHQRHGTYCGDNHSTSCKYSAGGDSCCTQRSVSGSQQCIEKKMMFHESWKVLCECFSEQVSLLLRFWVARIPETAVSWWNHWDPWRFGKVCKAGYDGKRISEENLWGFCCSTLAWWLQSNNHLFFMNSAGAVLCDADRLFGT